MKINKIKRLFEDDVMQMQMPAPAQPIQQMPQMQMPAPAQIQMPMDMELPSAGDEMEFPAPQEISPETQMGGMPVEISQMTVGDFLQKCKNVDALVCMGIEAFLEKNKEALMSDMSTALTQTDDELKNIEFGAGEEDSLPELEFPVEEPQSI